ncbi:myb/SANT-like DNA-binding domain-containing protein 4 [Crassostrea angulata]|uniref:myb/SANT-like DNA-binding domain-containing protein 4 n=1 Tax=Magallana angulata TaxID=2784310 RepID=UPI0022B1C44E|nr:myb/SANT-like DNA-binding domain-containing protein 4 [Crassostrea angulata]
MATKRERSSNWSLSEISILTEFFEKNEDVLKAKQSNLITNSRKNAKWAEVTEIINAVGIQRRTVDQVKFKWGNLQQSAKKSFSAARKQAKLTGGGPPPKPPTAAEEKIIDMMKDRPNFSGIVGGFESSMPVTTGVLKDAELDAPGTSSFVEYEESPQATETEAVEDVHEVENFDNTNQIVILPSMHNAEKESELGTKACTLNEPSVSDSRPKKRKKISIDELQRMQYEVLCCQKTHIGLKNAKIQKDIERSELETENLRLRNAKLTHEIELLKQNLAQNENALLALQALSDE